MKIFRVFVFECVDCFFNFKGIFDCKVEWLGYVRNDSYCLVVDVIFDMNYCFGEFSCVFFCFYESVCFCFYVEYDGVCFGSDFFVYN